MNEEIWKDIIFEENGIIWDYTGLYKISKNGFVKSLNYNHTGKEKELKFNVDKDGYRTVLLKGKRWKVHRLVAHMFVDGYFDGAEIDNINTIRDDNRSENLRWCTSKENNNNDLSLINRSEAHRGENNAMFGKHGKDNKNSIAIEKIDKNTGEILKIYDSITEARKDLGLKYDTNIRQCLKGYKRKTAHGFIWKYHKE